MPQNSQVLDSETWRRLIDTVFRPAQDERALAILVDLPDGAKPDNDAWRERRQLAKSWFDALSEALKDFTVELWHYPNVHTNNNDLPDEAWPYRDGVDRVEQLATGEGVPFEQLFARLPFFIAMSELSATAPLKLAARRHGFRGATMPRFSPRMMSALALDLEEVDQRCRLLKDLLDHAEGAHFLFEANGAEYRLKLDLRRRTAHASSGLLRQAGVAGNLPSGETYIVPYEGEIDGLASHSAGFLPVAFGDGEDAEVVVYEIQANKAVAVQGDGQRADAERQRIQDEPAYANLAELGLGVLGDLGIEPIGEILLDEKLGLHIAFGRSDHFGGSVGPGDFSSPDAVVHIDRVYLPGDAVTPARVELEDGDGRRLLLMQDGRYQVDFSASAEEAWGSTV